MLQSREAQSSLTAHEPPSGARVVHVPEVQNPWKQTLSGSVQTSPGQRRYPQVVPSQANPVAHGGSPTAVLHGSPSPGSGTHIDVVLSHRKSVAQSAVESHGPPAADKSPQVPGAGNPVVGRHVSGATQSPSSRQDPPEALGD